MTLKGMLALARLNVPNLCRAIPRPTDKLVSHALRQRAHNTRVPQVFHRGVSLNVDVNDPLILACREEAGSGNRGNNVHHEAFVVHDLFQVLIQATSLVFSVHLVGEVD